MPMRPPSCLPAVSRPPARHGTASSIDCLADASYNESKCAMRNIQLWRKPAQQNEMEEPMPFAEGQQGRLYWRVDGRADAPPLLLLNSLGTDFAMWDQVVPLLCDSFRVLRMDTRGHGASDVPEGDYTIAGLATDALSVLDAAGARTASVCGLSLGGMTALQLALAAPQRVSGVVACTTSAQVAAQPWLDRPAVLRRDGKIG